MSSQIIAKKAFKINQGDFPEFYVFSINSKILREIAYVTVRTKDNPQEGIQRILDPDRRRKIGQYIKKPQACFPNTIIISLSKQAKFDSDKDGTGTISIPHRKGEAFILDGQHRLYGFDDAGGKEFDLVISAFIDLRTELQAHIFRTINGEQKRVNKSLVYDLLSLDKDTEDFKTMRCHALIRELYEDKDSPWFHSISVTGPKEEGIISQANLMSYLLRLFSSRGGLFSNENYSNYNIQYNLIKDYFQAISELMPHAWANDKYMLCKTTGVDALLRLFPIVINKNTIKYPSRKDFKNFLEPIRKVDFQQPLYGAGGARIFAIEIAKKIGVSYGD